MLQTANLRLGLPVIVEHTVTPSSPLFDLSLAEMERRGVEIMWVQERAGSEKQQTEWRDLGSEEEGEQMQRTSARWQRRRDMEDRASLVGAGSGPGAQQRARARHGGRGGEAQTLLPVTLVVPGCRGHKSLSSYLSTCLASALWPLFSCFIQEPGWYTSEGGFCIPLHCFPVSDSPSRLMPVRSCFLDGMDPMTSNSVQARHSYR